VRKAIVEYLRRLEEGGLSLLLGSCWMSLARAFRESLKKLSF